MVTRESAHLESEKFFSSHFSRGFVVKRYYYLHRPRNGQAAMREKKKFFCSPTCTDITNNSGLHFFPYQTAEIQSSRRTAVKKKKKRTQDGKGNAGVVASTDLYSVLRMRCWMGTASSYLPNERILTRCVRAVCLSLVNRAELKVDHSKNKKLRHVADSMP